MNRLVRSIALILYVSALHAQEMQSPTYNVVSVKANKSGSRNSDMNYHANGLSAINVTLPILLETTYGIKSDLITGGPGWIWTERFDLNAKIVDPDPVAVKKLTLADHGTMLRPVLAERFHLKVHTETKTLPVYELVAAKGGPRLIEATQPDVAFHDRSSGSWGTRNTQFAGHFAPLSALVAFLEYQMHHTVLDKTGLTGKYDLLLNWSRDDASPSSELSAPDLVTALQEQLGLKLVPGKGPVDTLVIDHVEMPSEN